MNSSGFQAIGQSSPRRELQGPRPAPLKVSKDSFKIKKPPAAAAAPNKPPTHPTASAPPPQHRPPVIIYTVSPKVIHTNPGEFMALVQRLTGPSNPNNTNIIAPSRRANSCLSPAARLATIERSDGGDRSRKSRLREMDLDRDRDQVGEIDVDINGGGEDHREFNRAAGWFPGILSPVPSSLPPISPNFFAYSAEIGGGTMNSNIMQHHEQINPGFYGTKNFVDNSFLVSPNNFSFLSPAVPSPSGYWDLFNQFQDL